MAVRDPLLPNAAIVARREYRDRVRGPLFLASTVILAGLALLVAVAPIGIRYFDRGTVTRIAVVSSDGQLAQRALAVADNVLNVPPSGVDPATWQKPFALQIAANEQVAQDELGRGGFAGVLVVERLPTRQLDVTFRTNGPPDAARSQLVGFAAVAVGILDWTAGLPPSAQLGAFQTPAFRVEPINTPTGAGGAPLDPQQTASRSFLGIVFVVLLFMT